MLLCVYVCVCLSLLILACYGCPAEVVYASCVTRVSWGVELRLAGTCLTIVKLVDAEVCSHFLFVPLYTCSRG